MIKEKIQADTIAARKAKDANKLEALQAVKAATEMVSKDPTETDYITAVKKVVKQYQETAHYEAQAKREEAFNKCYDAYTMLEKYLPQSLTEDQLTILLDKVMTENSLTFEKKNMGIITKLTVAASNGATDGKMVSTMVAKMITLEEQENSKVEK